MPDGPLDEVVPDPGLVGTTDVLPDWLAAVVAVELPPGCDAAVGMLLADVVLSLLLPGWEAAVVAVVLPGCDAAVVDVLLPGCDAAVVAVVLPGCEAAVVSDKVPEWEDELLSAAPPGRSVTLEFAISDSSAELSAFLFFLSFLVSTGFPSSSVSTAVELWPEEPLSSFPDSFVLSFVAAAVVFFGCTTPPPVPTFPTNWPSL